MKSWSHRRTIGRVTQTRQPGNGLARLATISARTTYTAAALVSVTSLSEASSLSVGSTKGFFSMAR